MAAHCPSASAFTQGAAKRGPRQHLREHQSVMDEQSMGGWEGHRRARELPRGRGESGEKPVHYRKWKRREQEEGRDSKAEPCQQPAKDEGRAGGEGSTKTLPGRNPAVRAEKQGRNMANRKGEAIGRKGVVEEAHTGRAAGHSAGWPGTGDLSVTPKEMSEDGGE